MVINTDKFSQAEKPRGENRVYERYSICLGAFVQSHQSGGRHVTLQDFCISGMFLSFDRDSKTTPSPHTHTYTPTLRDTVIITCSVLVTQTKKELTFQGKVVRIEQSGLAIKFLTPDLHSLQILQEYAKASRIIEKKNGLKPSDNNFNEEVYNNKTAKQILHDCNVMVNEALTPIIAKFQEEIIEKLFDTSKNTLNTTELHYSYDTLKIINDKKADFSNIFCTSVINQIHEYSPYNTHDNSEEKHAFDAESLSLVGDDDFDDWLADTTTIESVESRCRNSLIEIEKRLSALYGCEITKENNPYGPGLFTKAFHEATYSLNMKHTINMQFYNVFKDILVYFLFDFYQTLNKYLKDNGVLPVIQHKLAKQKNHNPAKPPLPDNQSDKAIDDKSVTEITIPAPKTKQGTQDLYHIVGELRSLQKQLSEHKGYQNTSEFKKLNGPADHNNKQQNAKTPTYSSNEILDALSKLNTVAISNQNNDNQVADYKSAIMAVMENNGDNEGVKNIGARENNIMDVTSDIFHSMIADIQVSGKVRGWIQQLELPVLKMALVDDTVFLDHNHLVRQVINKISQLETLVGEAQDPNQSMIKRAIDWIINLVNEEFNGSTEVFARAVHQLDILLKSQDDTYNRNLTRVINKLKSEENEIILNNKVEEVKREINVKWQDIDESERQTWIKKALRINEGEWLIVGIKSDTPIRLRVAWFAPLTLRFVLVDLAGIKNRILHCEELAEHLKNGTISLLDNANEPVMDRAQYSIFQDLYTKLIHQTTHNQLTGLISRRELQNKIDNSIAESKHNKQQNVICFVDIDQIGVINNVCGYEGGDKLLKDVADLLVEGVGEQGIVAHTSSDEFAILLNDCTLDDGLDIIEEQMDALSEYRLIWEGKRLSTSCSIGIVSISHRNTKDSGTLIQQAESSSHIAKEMGGNRIQIFHAEHEKQSQRNSVMKWAAIINRILDEETLYLRCQQIISISDSDSGKHYEILLGIKNPDGGEISTPEFIEAAERYHRMPEVDRWVLKNAFRWITQNHGKLAYIEIFSINLSGQSLNDELFLNYVIEEMKAAKVPTEKICFEITETAGVSNLSNASDFIKKLKDTGCMFALDDFGTGMSSYAYLKNMPVDYLKIDGAFVKDLIDSPCDHAVVKSICEIGHFMGKKIVAEYVENQQILEQLHDIGVDFAQGYGIEKPRLLKDLVEH